MKKIIAIITLIVCCFSLLSCHDPQVGPDGAGSQGSIDINKIDFTETTLISIYQVWKQNRVRAEEQYVDKYVCISGTVAGIFSANYFSLREYQYDSFGQKVGYKEAKCILREDDKLKDILINLSVDDNITIKGKITTVDSFGYFTPHIDVYAIEVE